LGDGFCHRPCRRHRLRQHTTIKHQTVSHNRRKQTNGMQYGTAETKEQD
jgi:hypothetical protein